MAGIYNSLGLTGNPFAWVEDTDPGPFLDHLKMEAPQPGESRLLQLIGDKGAGKTTHLQHWQKTTGGPYYYVEPEGLARPPLAPIVYWDEADRVKDKQLRNLFVVAMSMKATVVAGTHRDLSAPAVASGLAVTTIKFDALTLEVLRRWCEARVARVSRMNAALVIDDDVLRDAISEADSSFRAAGDFLHIWVAEQARAAALKSKLA